MRRSRFRWIDCRCRNCQQNGDTVGFGFGAFWIASSGRLTKIDASSGASSTIVLDVSGGPCRDIGIGEGAVWVPDCGKGVIYKVDPLTDKIALTIPVDMFTSEGSIGVGEGSVWVLTPERGGRTLTRLNARTGDVEADIALPWSGTAVLVFEQAVWVTAAQKGALLRIDPQTNAMVASIPLGGTPKWIAAGEGSIWALNEGSGAVQRIDPRTNTVSATINLGAPEIGAITEGGGYLWISRPSHILSQIDPGTNSLVRDYNAPSNRWQIWGTIRYGAGSIWIMGAHPYRITGVHPVQAELPK